MPKRTRRDELVNHLATQLDEDGVIRNVPESQPYIPRDPGRRERLLWALRQTRINKEASHI